MCKRDLKSLNVDTDKWEELANDRYKWRSSVYKSIKEREKNNSLRDLSGRRIQSRMSFIYFICFFLHHCVCIILLKN